MQKLKDASPRKANQSPTKDPQKVAPDESSLSVEAIKKEYFENRKKDYLQNEEKLWSERISRRLEQLAEDEEIERQRVRVEVAVRSKQRAELSAKELEQRLRLKDFHIVQPQGSACEHR